MSGADHDLDEILAEYGKEVLRWNGQINLISRQDSSNRLAGLLRQCREGWDQLAASGAFGLNQASRLWYFDLGSGAGLPGIVWHAQMLAAGLPVLTRLVEPREKRAWFLERMSRLAGLESLQVLNCRWGETEAGMVSSRHPDTLPSHVVVSLKALHLTDSAVLEGLTPLLGLNQGSGPSRESAISILIARFYPPDTCWSDDLASDLDIPPAGLARTIGAAVFKGEGGSVLSPATLPGAGLVLSGYELKLG